VALRLGVPLRHRCHALSLARGRQGAGTGHQAGDRSHETRLPAIPRAGGLHPLRRQVGGGDASAHRPGPRLAGGLEAGTLGSHLPRGTIGLVDGLQRGFPRRHSSPGHPPQAPRPLRVRPAGGLKVTTPREEWMRVLGAWATGAAP
jgi:hypothetical protein